MRDLTHPDTGAYEEAFEYVERMLRRIVDYSSAEKEDGENFPVFLGYVPNRSDTSGRGQQRVRAREQIARQAEKHVSFAIFAEMPDSVYVPTFQGASTLATPFFIDFRSSGVRGPKYARDCSKFAINLLNVNERLISVLDRYDAPYDPDQQFRNYHSYVLEVLIR